MILSTAASALLALSMQQVSADDMAQSTATLTSACVKYTGSESSVGACGCGSGIMAERMTEVEFTIAAAVSPYVGNQAAMNEVIQNMVTSGVPVPTIQSAASKLSEAAPRVSRVCSVLSRPREQWRMVGNTHSNDGTTIQTISLPQADHKLGDAFREIGEALYEKADALTPR